MAEVTNIDIQNRLGLTLPPCYMLLPTTTSETWDTNIRDGYTVLIRCKPTEENHQWENHIYQLACVSRDEPQLMVNICKPMEDELSGVLNNPPELSGEFYNIENQYIWLPEFTAGKSWAQEIHRIIGINVEQRGILVHG